MNVVLDNYQNFPQNDKTVTEICVDYSLLKIGLKIRIKNVIHSGKIEGFIFSLI